MITFFSNEENIIRMIFIISMKGVRIRIVMLFCILDIFCQGDFSFFIGEFYQYMELEG